MGGIAVERIRTFLRYGKLIVELGPRPILVGRASTCDIVLDDDLASREHCRIALREDQVVVTDLGSKNGVLVNGIRIEETTALHHGDCLTVGTQQLVVTRQHRAPRYTPAVSELRAKWDDGPSESTSKGDIFDLLEGATRRALSDDDLPGAETSAQSLFLSVRTSCARGGELPHEVMQRVVDLGLMLADEAGQVRWIEQILEALVAARSTMTPEAASRLVQLGSRIGLPERAVASYLKMAREVGGPTDLSARILERAL